MTAATKYREKTLSTKKYPYSIEYLDSLRYQTPFMLTSVESAVVNLEQLHIYFPEFEVYYAMKSNPDRKILKALHNNGSHFEIASEGELKILQDMGVRPQTVLYSNPVKPPHHIANAHKAGVEYFVFDSIGELNKIATNAPGTHVYLRLKVSDQGSAFPLSSKFGATPDQATELMQHAVKLGLKPAGLTFHVGSQAKDLESWKVACEVAGRVMWELQEEGIKLEFLNIGGGLPVEYIEPVPSLPEVAKIIKNSLHIHLPYGVKLFMEPGRFLSASTSIIAASVIGREQRGGTEWLYLDVGTFNGLIEALEMPGWRFPVFVSERAMERDMNLVPFTLTGPTCDSQDTVAHEIRLPTGIDVGDRVYFGCTGAYTLTYAAPAFNGFSPPKVYYK